MLVNFIYFKLFFVFILEKLNFIKKLIVCVFSSHIFFGMYTGQFCFTNCLKHFLTLMECWWWKIRTNILVDVFFSWIYVCCVYSRACCYCTLRSLVSPLAPIDGWHRIVSVGPRARKKQIRTCVLRMQLKSSAKGITPYIHTKQE